MSRTVGKVKWFNNAKGYGFIEQPGEQDIFVHYSAISGDGYKSLIQGQEVEFEVTDGPKRPPSRECCRACGGRGLTKFTRNNFRFNFPDQKFEAESERSVPNGFFYLRFDSETSY